MLTVGEKTDKGTSKHLLLYYMYNHICHEKLQMSVYKFGHSQNTLLYHLPHTYTKRKKAQWICKDDSTKVFGTNITDQI